MPSIEVGEGDYSGDAPNSLGEKIIGSTKITKEGD